MAIVGSLLPLGVHGQTDSRQTNANSLVELNFPAQIELGILVDYVSERLKVRILYDEAVRGKSLSIKAPGGVPAESLLDVLQSALRMKGMTLITDRMPSWYRIVEQKDLPLVAETRTGASPAGMELAVTQSIQLRHLDPQQLTQTLKPFLSPNGANLLAIPQSQLLIITDFADNVQKITRLIELMDQGGPPKKIEFYQAQHVEAEELAKQVSQLLGLGAGSAQAGEATTIRAAEISADSRTNRLVIVGTESAVKQARLIIQEFDKSLEMKTEIYTLRYVNPERIDSIIRGVLDPLTVKTLYRSSIDAGENLLIVTATATTHERIRALTKDLDKQAQSPGSAVKYYKLKHASAPEVLQTIRSVEQAGDMGNEQLGLRGVSALGRGQRVPSQVGLPGRGRTGGQFVPGPNRPAAMQEAPTSPPAMRQDSATTAAGANAAGGEMNGSAIQGTPPAGPFVGGMGGYGTPYGYSVFGGAEYLFPPQLTGIVPGAAGITADIRTNTLIVVADRGVQEAYAELIKFLDQRLAQVRIEAKVVVIDTSDDYSLGVEVSPSDGTGSKRLLQFTSYGLSQVNPTTGALSLIPGKGFNWTLIDPEVADVVIRALTTHRRSRVLSAPQILVNDNATGTLASVAEVPFTSVNASNTVATTSFAGFAEAGTSIEVTPRISDDDHLQLDFTVSLNSFTGGGGAGVPPPRQTDEVASTVTVPDGHTIIVGGLNRTNKSLNVDTVPFLENIPILKLLAQNRAETGSQTTLFVFLRPVIMRDDKFRDLKYLSGKDLEAAHLPGNYPGSCPLIMR